MKRTAFLLAAAISCLAACTKEKDSGEEKTGREIEITASMADSALPAFLWNPDDTVNVFYGKASAKYHNVSKEPSAVTLFTSDAKLTFCESEAEDNYIWAIHPYSASNSFDGKSVSLTVPFEQTAVEGSFPNGSFPSAGRSRNMEMNFHYVCGGLKFMLNRKDVEKIELRGDSDEILAGKAEVSFDADGYPVVATASDGSRVVVLKSPEGTAFTPGTYYYLSALPGTFEGGLVMDLYTNKAVGHRTYSRVVAVKRGEVVDLGVADKGVLFIEDEVLVTSVSLDNGQLTIPLGDRYKLNATVQPSDATETGIWSSTNEDVAVVDERGYVSAKASGTATVSIKFKNVSASCEVTVNGDIVEIKQIDALERELDGVAVPECGDTLDFARGEAASLEFVVSALSGTFTDLKAEVVYFNAAGSRESGFAVRPKLYWARSVKAGGGWDQWAGGSPSDEVMARDNMYPDPLWPVEDCGERWMPTLSKKSKATLWCDIEIPRDIPAGVYSGLVRVEASGSLGTKVVDKEFAIKVYDVDLPEEQGLYVINWNDGDWWYMNGGKYPGYDAIQQYIDQTVLLMNDFGQNVWRVDDHRVDNVPASLDAAGNMVFDFSGFVAEAQHFIDLCPRMKMIHGRAFAETYPTDLGVNAWYVEDGELKRDILYSGDPRVETFLSEYARQFGEELGKHTLYNGRTWLESFAQSIRDEPEGDHIPAAWSRIARAMKKGCPELKFVEAIQTDCIDRSLIDYPCPTMNHLDVQRAQDGQTQWLYVCVQPQGDYANRFIRLPLLKDRYIYWCHFKYNAPGGLHWGLRYWLDKEDPYAEGFDLHRVYPAGDYCILYPGYKKVYPSIRACVLRDGIRDYDLLKMVEAKDPAKARYFLDTVVHDADDMDTNTAVFRSLRKEMLEYLSGGF